MKPHPFYSIASTPASIYCVAHMDIKEEEILGDNAIDHWYYYSKARALLNFLGDNKSPAVLDVGAGSGIFSKYLIDSGVTESAVCLDIEYPQDSETDYNGHNIKYLKNIDRIDQHLILMMDVIEHVDDDLSFIRHFVDMMPSGSKLLITVPAFEFLWSGHDIFLEHRRRYTLKQLEKVVSESGLTVKKSRYFFGILFPLIAAIRIINSWLLKSRKLEPKSSLTKHNVIINTILKYTHDVERCCLFKFNRIAGLSVFCLAEKE